MLDLDPVNAGIEPALNIPLADGHPIDEDPAERHGDDAETRRAKLD